MGAVTNLTTVGSPTATWTGGRGADAAALAAGVSVREVTDLAELAAVVACRDDLGSPGRTRR